MTAPPIAEARLRAAPVALRASVWVALAVLAAKPASVLGQPIQPDEETAQPPQPAEEAPPATNAAAAPEQARPVPEPPSGTVRHLVHESFDRLRGALDQEERRLATGAARSEPPAPPPAQVAAVPAPPAPRSGPRTEAGVLAFGYAAAAFAVGKTGNPAFRATAAALGLEGRVTPGVRLVGAIRLRDDAAIDSGLGLIGIEHAFGEVAFSELLGVRFGVLLVPVSRYNLEHEDWRFSFSHRPLVADRVLPSVYADAGVEVFGQVPIGRLLQLTYQVAAVNGLDAGIENELGGGAGLRDARPALASDNNAGKSFAARVAVRLRETLSLGASGYWGPYEDEGNTAIWSVGGDAEIVLPHLIARVEGTYANVQDGFALVDDDGDPATEAVLSAFPLYLAGGYADVEVRFWPEALDRGWFGRFGPSALFAAARFEAARVAFPTRSDGEIVVAGSVGYRPGLRTAVRLEGRKGWGELGLARGWEGALSFATGF